MRRQSAVRTVRPLEPLSQKPAGFPGAEGSFNCGRKLLPSSVVGAATPTVSAKVGKRSISSTMPWVRVPGGTTPGISGYERNTHDFLRKITLGPLPAPTKVIAVVAGENQQGIFEIARFSERVHETSELLVHVRGGSVVGALGQSLVCFGKLDAGHVGDTTGSGGIGRRGLQREALRGVAPEVRLRADAGLMRLEKSDRGEERTRAIAFIPKKPDRPLGNGPVSRAFWRVGHSISADTPRFSSAVPPSSQIVESGTGHPLSSISPRISHALGSMKCLPWSIFPTEKVW